MTMMHLSFPKFCFSVQSFFLRIFIWPNSGNTLSTPYAEFCYGSRAIKSSRLAPVSKNPFVIFGFHPLILVFGIFPTVIYAHVNLRVISPVGLFLLESVTHFIHLFRWNDAHRCPRLNVREIVKLIS